MDQWPQKMSVEASVNLLIPDFQLFETCNFTLRFLYSEKGYSSALKLRERELKEWVLFKVQSSSKNKIKPNKWK